MLTQPLIDKLLSDSAAIIEFDIRCCLRSRFNKNNCESCLQVCSSNALQLHDRQIIFDAEKCTGCLQCTAVCPNDAFVDSVDVLQLIQVLAEKETVLLSCEKGMDSHNHLTVPCIGFLSEQILAVMNSVARGNCFMDISRCEECENGDFLKTLHENLQNVIHKMRGKGKFRLRYFFDNQCGFPAGEKNERRSFLRLARKTLADMGKEAVRFQFSDSAEIKNPQRKKQARHTVALQYALSITPEERIDERDVLLSYFFSVSTNERCDCCPSCTGMCPTGALKRKREKDKKHLTFTSARCSGCGLCADFCRKNALILSSGFSGDPNNSQQIQS